MLREVEVMGELSLMTKRQTEHVLNLKNVDSP